MCVRDFGAYVLAMSFQSEEKEKQQLGYYTMGQLNIDAEQKKPDTHALTLHDSIYGEYKNRPKPECTGTGVCIARSQRWAWCWRPKHKASSQSNGNVLELVDP